MALTMRAAVLLGPRRIEVLEVPRPTPKEGQVLIAIEGCGLCGSNLPLWQGRPWFDYPRSAGAPGHEAWGHIAALGEGVTELTIGQRVSVLSENGFAEYDVADADQVAALPRSPLYRDVPGEALGCAINVLRRSQVSADHTVVVVGVGFIGALVIQLAANLGARVVAVSRRPFGCRIAEIMGADATLVLGGHAALTEWLSQETGRPTAERVIEAAGTQRGLSLSTSVIADGGRLVVAGYHQDGTREIDMQTWNWRGIDVINAHERDPHTRTAGMRAAIDALVSHRLDPEPLYTHRIPLGRIPEAFELLESRPDGFLKALVCP